MNRIRTISASAVFLASTLGLSTAYATPSATHSKTKAIEITGCLEQGPVAKEYLLQASDGTTWGVNEADLRINNYVGRTVTVAGDATHPTAAERMDGGAKQYLRAMDIVLESESCSK
jgi:hypothetical protein